MLSKFLPDEYFNDIYEIDIDILVQKGIRGIICDIDNTLVPYEEPEPTQKVKNWISSMNSRGIKISFVSNNDAARVEKFNQSIGFFASADSKKPSRKKLLEAMNAMNTDKTNTAMLGDQIFTDVYAGKRAGLYCILVNPIKDKKNFLFRFKRTLEKPVLAYYKIKKGKVKK